MKRTESVLVGLVCAVLARRYKRQTEQLQAQQESSADKA